MTQPFPTPPAFRPEHDTAPRRHRRWLVAAGVVLLALVVDTCHRGGLATHATAVVSERVESVPMVVGLGWIEPGGTVVRVAAPGNPDAARVVSLTVGEGDRVAPGQLLAILDNAAQRSAQVVQAEAQVRMKETQLAQRRADHASQLAARRAAAERARAELRVVELEHDRLRALLTGGNTTRAAYDRTVRDLALAGATLREAEAALARHTTEIDGMAIDVAIAAAELASARTDLAVAQESLELAFVRAPAAGTILSVKAREGERIGADGLLELGAIDRMRAIVEVYQTDVARVRVGQPVALRADALPGRVEGRVDRVGLVVRRQTVINADPATATDARVVEVVVALPPEHSAQVAALSRLQVTAVFAP